MLAFEVTSNHCPLWFIWMSANLLSKNPCWNGGQCQTTNSLEVQKLQVYIYCLYFQADILHLLLILSQIFQLEFVDVTTVSSVVRIYSVDSHILYRGNTKSQCQSYQQINMLSYHTLIWINWRIYDFYSMRLGVLIMECRWSFMKRHFHL